MAKVKVAFPGGKSREIAAKIRLVETRKGNRREWVEVLEPVADPDWRFVSMIGGWRAYPLEAGQVI